MTASGKPRLFRKLLRWAGCLTVGALLLVLVLALAGAVYQAVGARRDRRNHPAPGAVVDVGGHRLHVQVMGEGSPTVVMDHGGGGTGLDWALVAPEVAKLTRVVTYDHAGLGWSEQGSPPRTSERIVKELRTLLEKTGVEGPYILVGHSLGGYNVRLFCHQYPSEVVGLVLVDASH